jgi:myo-inositol-1(or 4)-monophosphatase
MLNDLNELARIAGRIAHEHFLSGAGTVVREKGPRDYVTHVDRLIEDTLIRRIQTRFPEHRVLGEEGLAQDPPEAHRTLWIIDPIDGTTNFLRGIPAFAISIAVCPPAPEGGWAPRWAAVYDPTRDELFTAEAGAGLWLNGKRSYAAPTTDFAKALIASALPFRCPEALDDCARVFVDVQRRCDDQRRGGSAALDLAWVAVGRLDGYYELGIHPWDTAAGELLVRCGGGVATDYRGATEGITGRRSVVAGATPEVHAQLLTAVTPLRPWLDRAPFAAKQK